MTANLTSHLHNAEVDFHRSVFKIRPVDLHHFPGWWSARICFATKGWGRHDAWHGLHELERRAGTSIFDHHGASVDETGRPVYATEPYPPGDQEKFRRAVAEIAGALGLHYRILPSQESWWYPLWTVRVEFSECDGVPLCHGCKSREQLRDESRARKRKGKAVRA